MLIGNEHRQVLEHLVSKLDLILPLSLSLTIWDDVMQLALKAKCFDEEASGLISQVVGCRKSWMFEWLITIVKRCSG